MVTFHEIKGIIQKMAVLSSYVGQLGQLLPAMIQLTEKIGSINEDLTLERDRITAKMRSVEVLGEILKAQVYQNTDIQSTGGSMEMLADNHTSHFEHGSPMADGIGQSNEAEKMTGQQGKNGLFPGLNSGSLMI